MWTPAFEALSNIVERLTCRSVKTASFYTWTSPSGKICVPLNDVEGLLHEFCHWLAADPSKRDTDDYGLEDEAHLSRKRIKQQDNQEKMCGWIEDELYGRAGVQRPLNSVDDINYRRSPCLKRPALERLKSIAQEDVDLIVAALKLVGGSAGAYSSSPDSWPFNGEEQ